MVKPDGLTLARLHFQEEFHPLIFPFDIMSLMSDVMVCNEFLFFIFKFAHVRSIHNMCGNALDTRII